MSTQVTLNKTLQLIRCYIGEETYCLDTFWVKSIQNSDDMLVNKTSETPTGWITYQEQKVPVFSLAVQLKQQPKQNISKSKVIIFNSSPMWGIVVDRVSRVFEVGKENFFPLPTIIENPSVAAFQGIIKMGEEMFLYLAPQFLHPKSPTKKVSKEESINFNWGELANKESKIQYKGQILTFSIGEHKEKEKDIVLGLSVTQVIQILKSAKMINVPMSQDYVVGFIEWQNVPVPVIDLNLYLGLKGYLDENVETRVLIARSAVKEGLVAILIKPIIKSLTLPFDHKVTKSPFLTDRPISVRAFEVGKEVLVILDIDGIIGVNTVLSTS
jgi:chemotaxis signal transduction protein